MIITVVCDVLGEKNNGTSIAAYNLINSLIERGHSVNVLCPDNDKKGVPGYFILPTVNFGPFNNYVAKNGIKIAKPKRKIIRKALEGVDAIHIMTPFWLGRYAAKYARKHNIPISAGFHCQAENISSHLFLMNSQWVTRKIYKNLYKHFYKYCDAIHYPTAFICHTFENVVGLTPHHIISNGVSKEFNRDIPHRRIPDGSIRILYIGRYSKEKSHKTLIKAVNYSKYKNRIQLIFAGEGPQREAIEKCAESLILKPIMQFYSREKLIEVIGTCDLYVHPAQVEIEAISCLEAISCGLVPIINDSPSCATKYFAIDRKNLFNYNNPKHLAKRIDYWLDHPEKREARSLEYADFAKQWDFDKCMDAMEAMLKGIIYH